MPAYTGGDLWATQLVQTDIQLVSGKWYKATVTLTSDIDSGTVVTQKSDYSGDVSRQSISLTAGETKM